MRFLLLPLILLSLPVFSMDEEYCRNEAKYVGGKNNVPVQCFDVVTNKENIFYHTYRTDLKLELKILGQIAFWKNLETDEVFRVAGDKTSLELALSIDVDPQNKIIYVLNQDKDQRKHILAFKKNWQGNVYPWQVIQPSHLPQDVVQIVFDAASRRILALNSNGRKVYSIVPGNSSSIKTKRPLIEKTYTFKEKISYLHASSAYILIFKQDGTWDKFRSLNDTILDSGDFKNIPVRLPAGLSTNWQKQ
jgi:hypothetical protein